MDDIAPEPPELPAPPGRAPTPSAPTRTADVRALSARWTDLAAIVLSAVVAVLVTRSELRSGPVTVGAVAAVAAAVGACALLWWRRRWPVAVALALAGLSCFWPVAQLPALIGLGSVAGRRSRRVLAVLVLVYVVAVTVRLWPGSTHFRYTLEINSTGDTGARLAFSLLLSLVVVAAALYLGARRQLLASLAERARTAETEQLLRAEQARTAERTRIAREMHDVLAHQISLISLQAGALQVGKLRSDEEVTESAVMIRQAAHRALDDLREVIGVLREDGTEGSPLAPQPGLAEVRGLVRECARAGMAVSLEERLGPVVEGISPPVGRTVYRVVQEGLTNARKHSPGAAVSVTLSGTSEPDDPWARGSSGDPRVKEGVRVEVRNPGPGAEAGPGAGSGAAPGRGALPEGDRIPGAGVGLVGLRERIQLVGGRLDHGWGAAGEFRLSAWLPLREDS